MQDATVRAARALMYGDNGVLILADIHEAAFAAYREARAESASNTHQINSTFAGIDLGGMDGSFAEAVPVALVANRKKQRKGQSRPTRGAGGAYHR